ncbi:MAG: hypothetical protein J6Q68_04060 [Clostridia bacterium]|nr:hypothetical protein [Clostridia bacterium]
MSFIDILLLNAKDYFDTVFDVYINIIIFAIALAICASAFVINHHKTYTVRIIRQLLRRGGTGEEENALTLAQLRLSESKSLKRALARDGQLTDIVKRVGEKTLSYEEYVALQKQKKTEKETIDFESARFYIPEASLERAQRIEQRENPSIPRTILLCVLIITLSVCLACVMPEILSFISNNISFE